MQGLFLTFSTLHSGQGGNLILILIIIINLLIYFIILLLIKDPIKGMQPEKLSFYLGCGDFLNIFKEFSLQYSIVFLRAITISALDSSITSQKLGWAIP